MTGIEIIVSIALGAIAYVLLRALMLGFFTIRRTNAPCSRALAAHNASDEPPRSISPLVDDLPEVDRERYRRFLLSRQPFRAAVEKRGISRYG